MLLSALLWSYKANWRQNDFDAVEQKQSEQSRQEIDAKMAELAYWGYRIYLADIAGMNVKGEAAYRFMNDRYELLVTAELPSPPDGYFYEGWLVRSASAGQISVGKLFKQSDGRYTVYFSDQRNYSDFSRVVIALEPDDGNPEPGKHILEGDFQ